MGETYTPAPGTYAAKAIDWLRLQPEGTRVTSSTLRKAIGLPVSTRVYHALTRVIEAGMVIKHGAGTNNKLGWSLPAESFTDMDENEGHEQEWTRRTSAPEIQPRPGPFLPGIDVGMGARRITPVSVYAGAA